MDSPLAVLCADETSLQHPRAIGIPEENLASQKWLRLFSSGEDARRFLRSDTLVDEVWIASSEDVEPINLAASLKGDRSDRCVCLLAFEGTGSLKSRAAQAGIDATLTRQAFSERYAQRKRRQVGPSRVPSSRLAASSCEQRQRLGETESDAPVARKPHGKLATESRLARSVPRRGADTVAHEAFLLPVVSGSGGSGKSTIAVLSAIFAQGLGYKTLLIDFDLQFGDVASMLGMRDFISVDEALAASEKITRLKSGDMTPAVLAAPRRLEECEMIDGRMGELLDAASHDFDIIIANTGTNWTEQHATLLERSSKALFLVDQRVSSLRACQHALDLCARCGIATGPFQLVANRCSKHALYTSLDVSCALGGMSVLEFQDGGRDVEELMGAGLSLDLAQSRNALCESVGRALTDVLPRRDDLPPGLASAHEKKTLSWGFFRGRKRRAAACPF